MYVIQYQDSIALSLKLKQSALICICCNEDWLTHLRCHSQLCFLHSQEEKGQLQQCSAQVSLTMWNGVTTVIRVPLFCSNISRQPRVQFRRGRGGTPDLWSAIEILDKSSHIHHPHTHRVTLGKLGGDRSEKCEEEEFRRRLLTSFDLPWTFESLQVHLR